MKEFKVSSPAVLEDLFRGRGESFVQSYLQGYTGVGYADAPEHPESAIILAGDFCVFAGPSNQALLRYMAEDCGRPFLILAPEDEAWGQAIEDCFPEKCRRITRYATKRRRPEQFDRSALSQLAGQQAGYLKAIDRDLFTRVRGNAWSADLVSNYESFEVFEKTGLGFVVERDGTIVSGASSYLSYREGIEIEIDTDPAERQKGFASAAGAALILACLERGIYPNWDAHDRRSLHLAEKLGYELDRAYTAYELEW